MLVTIFGHVGKQRCLNLQHIDNMNVAWMIILDVVVNLCINMERLPAYVICYNNIYMDIALYRLSM